MRFYDQKYQKTQGPKMTSKFLGELLIWGYKRFKYFSQTRNLAISKNTYVNHEKCEHHGEMHFNREKIQEMQLQKNELKTRLVNPKL